MPLRLKIYIAITGWLLFGLAVFLAPESLFPAGWRRELVGIVALPVFLALAALFSVSLELLLRAILWAFIACISLGRARVERHDEYVPMRFGVIGRGKDGKLVLDEDAAWLLLIAVVASSVGAVVYAY